MRTIVAGEAIEQGAPFDNYILTQGAIPAHCYDTNAPFLQKLLDAEVAPFNVTQFYPTNGGYHGYLSGIQGNVVNFFNTNDFALATGIIDIDGLSIQTNWEENQRTQKPEHFAFAQFYTYFPIRNETVAFYQDDSRVVTDIHEILALVARSRSKAVGAQAGVGGIINTNASVDLVGAFGFDRTRSEHSAQFDRPVQTVWPYYDQVLSTLGINHIER